MDEITNQQEPRQPLLSYQVLKYIGMVLLTVSQLVTLNHIYSLYFDTPSILDENGESLLKTIGQIGLPLVLIATLAGIVYNRKRIFLYLGFYAAGAISFVFLEQLAIHLYVIMLLHQGGVSVSAETLQAVEQLIITLLNEFISLNVFVDLFLCACFFFFMFYRPKKNVFLFRICIALPILYLITGYVLTVLRKYGILSLNFYAVSFLPSKKPIAYAIVFAILIYLKVFNGGGDEFIIDSRSFALYLSLAVVFFCIIDALFSFMPWAKNFQVGDSYMLCISVPFLLCFDYKKPIRHRWISYTVPAYYAVSYGVLLFFYSSIVIDILSIFA